jgi:DNA repair protein SbcC/Rad50
VVKQVIMIPIKLTIQGLFSYQERQTIDFKKLTEAHLFGIFGLVGSGKSSILDAITFALYGETERMNARDNRNYNMMNLKSDELFIEFDFCTGKDGATYRSVVRGKRNRKRFDDVKTLDRSAYKNLNGIWEPIEIEKLQQVIGLSYENFKRTIIIPQGKFQEFLQLGNKDRTQMMKELFNLEKFELYLKVASLENKNNAQKQNIEGQLQQLGVIDPELAKRYEEKLAQLKTEIGQISKILTDNQRREVEWKKLRELVRKMAETQLRLKQLKDKEPEFAALETTIRNYEHCLIQFKSQVDALTQSDKKIIQKSGLIEKEIVNLKNAEAEIAASEATFTKIKEDYDHRDLLRQKADELVKIARLNVLQTAVFNDEERIKKGNLVLDKTIESFEKLKLEKETLELLLKSERAKLPDLTMLSQVKIWHTDHKNLNRQLTEIKAEIAKYQKEIQAISDAVKVSFQEPIFSVLANDADISVAIRFLKTKIDQSKQQIAQLDGKMAHYQVQSKLEEYAVNLHDGEACPLCGSTQHPAVFNAVSVAGALSEAAKLKVGLEKEITLANEYINQLSDLGNRLKFNTEHFSDWSLKQNDLDLKVANHATLFQWEDFKDENAVNQAFVAAEILQKILKEKEKEFEKVTIQLEKEASDKVRFQSEIEKIRIAFTITQTEIKTLSKQIQLIDIDEFRQKTTSEIETEKKALLQRHATLEKQHNELINRLIELRKSKDTVGGSLEANRKELLQEQEANDTIKNKLSISLKQSNFASIEDVKQILIQEINLDLQKQKLSDFGKQLMLSQNQTDQLRNEIANRSYDNDAHQKLLAEIDVISENLNQKNQELGQIRELLKKLQNDMESQVSLLKELDNLELRAEDLKTMKQLFKGSGFVNYVSSVHLQNLCLAANDRFYKLVRQKMSLEITEDNNFQVRDFLNGGKIRSVKTLSGGQTFQAALSLALALADSIQQFTMSSQNFFFLDEGFGSLDKESLDIVFETLKSLRKENRIVGVISHVEEMQQEIDTHLRIVNDEETGSRVYRSWEN